ncbi:hypothetical protein MMC10_010060 [Thelotrema lepadinum]|nr:hypothetical protein [Thelotrema lepadinum]
MSSVLNDRLLPRLREVISSLLTNEDQRIGPDISATHMIATIKETFAAVDGELLASSLAALSLTDKKLSNPLAEILHRLAPFYAGSCALVCLYDHAALTLYTACTGDSRAILVRQDMNGKYIAMPLSEDQTGFNPSEAKRVRDEHPGEYDCIDDKTGRVLGMAVTRAFGDHRFKLPLAAIETMRDKFFGAAPRPGYKTPPYLTAEPEVTVTRIQEGDVLIMASDGLWDHMSNTAATECLGRWLTKYQEGGDIHRSESSILPGWLANNKSRRDILQEESSMPYEFSGEPDWQVEPKYIVTEDKNAATHLIRNTLGGNRRALFTGIMSALPPLSREARDDITVQVVLF